MVFSNTSTFSQDFKRMGIILLELSRCITNLTIFRHDKFMPSTVACTLAGKFEDVYFGRCRKESFCVVGRSILEITQPPPPCVLSAIVSARYFTSCITLLISGSGTVAFSRLLWFCCCGSCALWQQQ